MKKYGIRGTKVKSFSIIRIKSKIMGIILAKAKMFGRTGVNESVHVTKPTSSVQQYLSPIHKTNFQNIKKL